MLELQCYNFSLLIEFDNQKKTKTYINHENI